MRGKRSKLQKRDGIQATLERYRRFDHDYLPFGTHWETPTASYRYHQNAFDRALSGVIRTILAVLAPLLIKVLYGAKVTGKEYLKPLKGKGAICICNHISYLDTLFVRQAVGQYRSYHTMAPFNNKTGVGGWFIHHAGMLPFSSNLTATRNLWKEMELLLKKGKIINFYADQAMWINYQKPRPMKEGAFSFATKYSVPVVPIFCTFQKDRHGHMKKLRINILPPIYPDETLKKNERTAAMLEAAQAEWQACYEKAYGIPLTYLDRKPNEKKGS